MRRHIGVEMNHWGPDFDVYGTAPWWIHVIYRTAARLQMRFMDIEDWAERQMTDEWVPRKKERSE